MAQRLKQFWHKRAGIGTDDGGVGVDFFLANGCIGPYTTVVDEDGDATAVVGLTAAVDYKVAGVIYQLAAGSTVWDCRGLTTVGMMLDGVALTTVQDQNRYCTVVFCADSAGAVSPVQSEWCSTAALALAAIPATPTDAAVLGYIPIDSTTCTTGYGSSFTWVRTLGTYGTYYLGYPQAALVEVIDPDA